jgi:uncharacterized protein YndB with AHSA1/START domain
MATVSRRRRLPVELVELWRVLADPHHLPRWWPGVTRVEGVAAKRFTQVHISKRGRPVRMDFLVTREEPPFDATAPTAGLSWRQELEGTPFERLLTASEIDIDLQAREGATEVQITQRQRLRGTSRTGGWLARRASRRKLGEALAGLERLF